MAVAFPKPHLDDLLELRHQARALGIASHHLVNTTFTGLYASVFRGQGLNFEEVREYREGDDIRNMDWKVTARTGDPHLKVFREERERSVLICVDVGPHMAFGTRGTFKSVQAARACALLGWAANSLHDRVGGLLIGDLGDRGHHFRPTKDRRALWRMLHALTDPPSSARPSPPALLPEMLRQGARGLGSGGLVFVIADFNRPQTDLRRALALLCQHNTVVLVPVDDPAERDLPAMGKVLFRGPEGELLEVDTDDAAGRRAWREAWQRRRDALNAIASRVGVTVIPIRTDEDVHHSLMEGLRRRARFWRGL
ncbi:MAG TPA: DUF58 domain-containing protein [Thiotrichales bacterium]|nr:DUF58 domain-containing protein [Thiotrichales bacterium]